MDLDWQQQLGDIERRALSVNVAITRLCVLAGVHQSNLWRWRQGQLPSIRVLRRDLPKLKAALLLLEYELAVELITRINPEVAPHIIGLLQSPNAGDPGGRARPAGNERDRRRDGNAGNAGQAHSLAG